VVSQIDEVLEEDKESENSSEESTHDSGICPNVFHHQLQNNAFSALQDMLKKEVDRVSILSPVDRCTSQDIDLVLSSIYGVFINFIFRPSDRTLAT